MTAINRPRGMAYGLAAIAVLTPDALTLRLADFDAATLIAGRGLLCALGVVAMIAIFGPRRLPPMGAPLLAALAYGATFGVGMATFVLSIRATHVANVLVIISSAPLVAALLSVCFLRDRLPWYTWLAACIALAAAVLVFLASAPVGFANSRTGNLYSLCNVLMLSIGVVIVRRFASTDIVAGIATGAFLAGLVWLPAADFASLNGRQWAILLVNGLLIQGVAFWLLNRAARLLPPPEISLLFLVELAFAPLLVWLVLDEQPQLQVVVAGGIMMAVFIAHAWATAVLPAQPTATLASAPAPARE